MSYPYSSSAERSDSVSDRETQAISFARKAVELAPAEVRYSVALAQYLTGHQEPTQAMKVLEALPNARSHLFYRLLSDFEAFPIPEQAVFDPATSQTFAQMQAESGNFSDYRHERVRVYVIPASIKDLDTFFPQRCLVKLSSELL